MLPLVTVLAFLAAVALTALARSLAIRWDVLDIPNARSSHVRPTPRGGGVAIVAVTLAATAYATSQGLIDLRVGVAIGVAGAGVGLLGAIDDRQGLANSIRLPVWLGLAAGAVFLLEGLPTLDVGSLIIPLGLVGAILAVLGVVWLINLYNFMDGIDGLAGSQAVITGAAGGGMLLVAGETGLAMIALALAASSAGFLVWNWPPAKIFMGDVGSGFIGGLFALLAIASERAGAVPVVAWGILLAPFLIDATFTLAMRIARREPFHQPHKSHVYQRLVRRGRTHRRVTLMYAATAAALVPIAYLSWVFPGARAYLASSTAIVLGGTWLVLHRSLETDG